MDARDADRAHQAGDALAATADSLLAQRRVHPRAAVGLATVGMDDPDLLGQHLVRLLPRRGTASQPGVVAGARDAQRPAQHGDRIGGLLRDDEPIAAHSVSFAK